MIWVDEVVKKYLAYRMEKILRFKARPLHYQKQVFHSLLRKASSTEYGKKFGFSEIKNYKEWTAQIPLVHYEELHPWIHRAMKGERNLLWPGRTKLFSKSSGTTQGRSKYIPVTAENVRGNHIRGSWDSMAILYHHHKNLRIFHKKSLVLGGSIESFAENPETKIGDISALMIDNMPGIAKPYFIPDTSISLLPDWEEKIEKLAEVAIRTPDVVLFGGVPTWNIVLFRRMLEMTGKDNLLDIWPDVNVYFHGGVGFSPYKETFQKLIPRDDFVYQETYNASEGLFAIQDVLPEDLGMLLMLDSSVFYEFIPLAIYGTEFQETIPLGEVEASKDYVLVVSTNAGLWRYIPGDVISFSSIYPYRIRITGRTQQFINAFGEELMIHNADKAIGLTCKSERCEMSDYTVAPFYLSDGEKGKHQWYIEFKKSPGDKKKFALRLDHNLRKLNSDYDAKRRADLALDVLEIIELENGTFRKWLETRGKLGSQSKIPRLSNSREYADELEKIIEKKLME